jgi:hypothetical protein
MEEGNLNKPVQKKKKTKNNNDDDDEDDTKKDENYITNHKNYYEFININPLPGFMDPITQEEVEKPAISPLGYVMGITIIVYIRV